MKKNILIRNGFVALALVFATFSAHTYQSQAPANRNGSPASNGNTCAVSGCHSGPNITDQTVTITTDIPASGFQNNTEYNITIEGNRGTSTATTSGFEASFEAGGNFEGMISTASFPNVKTVGVGNFATHNGKKPFIAGVTTWMFKWNSGNAPDGTTIYAAINFANNNGNKNGDIILSESLTLMKAQNISIDENVVSHLNVFPNPASNELTISFANNGNSQNRILLYDLQGSLVKELFNGKINSKFKESYSISDLAPGIYILNIQNENGLKQEQIIVQ